MSKLYNNIIIFNESGNEFAPGQVVETLAVRLRPANGHVGRRFHDPFEIIRLNRVDFGIRCRIAEIDSVRHAFADGQLDGVKIIPQYPV